MAFAEISRLLEITIWPLVALVAIFVVRPHLSALMSRSKLKLSMFGQSIEMSLPELQEVIREQAEGALTPEHLAYLESLYQIGSKAYPEGVQSGDRKFLRPLRNSGLIVAVPKDAFLAEAKALQLSALGRVYLRARRAEAK